MKKNQIFRSILLSAVAATTFSTQVSAQSYDNYNKRELLLQVLDQSRPNDYVPVFFNVHFPDKFGYKAVKSHVDWFRTTHVDFVNVKYEFIPQQVTINNASDFKKIKEVTPQEWEEQIQVVRELARELKSEAFIIPTVYSPLALLNQAAGTWNASDPKAAKKKLRVWFTTSAKLARPVPTVSTSPVRVVMLTLSVANSSATSSSLTTSSWLMQLTRWHHSTSCTFAKVVVTSRLTRLTIIWIILAVWSMCPTMSSKASR